MSKILVVDDDMFFRKMIGEEIQKEGYIVIEAENGVEGFDLMVKEKPQLIILDILMPVMSGISMLQTVRNSPEGKDIPIVILTSTESGNYISDAMTYKISSYIDKEQLNIPEFISNIHKILQDK